jgi:hypothetical protein
MADGVAAQDAVTLSQLQSAIISGALPATTTLAGIVLIATQSDWDNTVDTETIGPNIYYNIPPISMIQQGILDVVQQYVNSSTTVAKFDDFLNANETILTTAGAGTDPQAIGNVVGELGWTLGANTNATATITPITAGTGRPGQIQMTCTTSDLSYLALSGSNTIQNFSTNGTFSGWDPSSSTKTDIGPMNQGNYSFTHSFKLDQTTSAFCRVGISNVALGGAFTRGIYFEYDSTIDGNWRGWTLDGTGNEQTVVLVAADTSYHKFEIIMNAAGTSVEFIIDGVSLGSNTTHIPTAGGVPFFMIGSNGVASKSMTIDYWTMSMTVAAR